MGEDSSHTGAYFFPLQALDIHSTEYLLCYLLNVICDIVRQIILLRTNVAGFRDTLCDTQPVTELSDSDEIFAVELPPVCSADHVTALVVNTNTSSSLR